MTVFAAGLIAAALSSYADLPLADCSLQFVCDIAGSGFEWLNLRIERARRFCAAPFFQNTDAFKTRMFLKRGCMLQILQKILGTANAVYYAFYKK